MIRIGLIGCGYWGPNLARNFSEAREGELVAVADLDKGRLAAIQRRYPKIRVTTDPHELIAAKDVDALAIATPVQTHFPLALEALRQGKHLLVEKPLALDVAQAEGIVELAAQRKLTLMVDHTFVYTGAVRKLKQLFVSGEIGDLLYVDSVRINLGLLQHDINVIMDLAPHDLSIADHLVERRPKSVIATGASHARAGVADIAYLSLDYGDNLIANFHVSWISPVKIRHMIFGGSRKTVVYNDLEPSEKLRVYDRGIDVKPSTAEGIEKLLVSYRLGDAWMPALDLTEGLREVTAHFISCIERGERPLTDGEAGLRVVKVLAAANESLKAGGARVEI